jgi:hypothetical protein
VRLERDSGRIVVEIVLVADVEGERITVEEEIVWRCR